MYTKVTIPGEKIASVQTEMPRPTDHPFEFVKLIMICIYIYPAVWCLQILMLLWNKYIRPMLVYLAYIKMYRLYDAPLWYSFLYHLDLCWPMTIHQICSHLFDIGIWNKYWYMCVSILFRPLWKDIKCTYHCSDAFV